MEFGFSLPSRGPTPSMENLHTLVQHTDALRLDSVWVTLDKLSNGRVILGIGVGWMEEEFVALGLDTYRKRGAVSDDYIRAFRELWSSDSPHFKGEYVRFAHIGFAPKPVRQPPIWTSAAFVNREATATDWNTRCADDSS